MWYHFPAMDFTQLQIMQKKFENKISIIFTILFDKTLHSYNNLFSWSEGVFKGHKHSFILVIKMKLKKKFLNVYISHGFQCDSTCILMWQKLFISIIMCEWMHISMTNFFNMNYHVWINAH
jgi:hypothetical protein